MIFALSKIFVYFENNSVPMKHKQESSVYLTLSSPESLRLLMVFKMKKQNHHFKFQVWNRIIATVSQNYKKINISALIYQDNSKHQAQQT